MHSAGCTSCRSQFQTSLQALWAAFLLWHLATVCPVRDPWLLFWHVALSHCCVYTVRWYLPHLIRHKHKTYSTTLDFTQGSVTVSQTLNVKWQCTDIRADISSENNSWLNRAHSCYLCAKSKTLFVGSSLVTFLQTPRLFHPMSSAAKHPRAWWGLFLADDSYQPHRSGHANCSPSGEQEICHDLQRQTKLSFEWMVAKRYGSSSESDLQVAAVCCWADWCLIKTHSSCQDFMNDVRKIVQKEVPTALPSVIGFATRCAVGWCMISRYNNMYACQIPRPVSQTKACLVIDFVY